MGGWNPVKAIASAAKSIEHGVAKGASLAYRGAKFAATKPFVYVYKGVRYIGEKAMQFALKPIKMVVGRFKKKMVNRKAAELAQQRGLSAPGPTEIAQASAWAKNVTQHSGSRYARAAASLMGSERFDPGYGMRDVDLTFGDDNDGNDLMGVAPALLYPLIVLGAVGLAVILDKVYNAAFKHSSAPAPAADPNAQDPNAVDPGAMDPSAIDPGSADASAAPGAYDPGAGDPGAGNAGAYDDGSADSSGYADNLGLHGRARDKPKPRSKKPYKTDWSKNVILQKFPSGKISVEQMNKLSKEYKFYANNLIKMGRLRLA